MKVQLVINMGPRCQDTSAWLHLLHTPFNNQHPLACYYSLLQHGFKGQIMNLGLHVNQRDTYFTNFLNFIGIDSRGYQTRVGQVLNLKKGAPVCQNLLSNCFQESQMLVDLLSSLLNDLTIEDFKEMVSYLVTYIRLRDCSNVMMKILPLMTQKISKLPSVS